MNELITILALLATGILLGLFFFGGLWWTVRRALSSRHPALWLFVSQILRTAVVLGAFFFVARGVWQHILVCLLGFIIARIFILRRLRPNPGTKSEVDHAS